MSHEIILPNGIHVHSLNRNETMYLYGEIFQDQIYTPASLSVDQSEPCIFDVGANIGLFALFAAQRYPGARIYAFEPAPTIFDTLKRNVAQIPGATVFNIALGDADETRLLTFYPRYTMMSGFCADPAADKALVRSYIENISHELGGERGDMLLAEADELIEGRFETAEQVSCRIERLDSVAARLQIQRIDLLKVDVEGFEVRVLRGIGETLWPRIMNIAIEVKDDNGELAEACTIFESHGMHIRKSQPTHYSKTNLYNLTASRL